MTGCPVCWLCQMAAVSARSRWSMRTITPPGVRLWCRSRSSCPLNVSLIDSMTCRNGLNSCDRLARLLPCGPVLSPSGQVGTLDRLPGTAAFDRCGVHHPYIVGPQCRVRGQLACDLTDEFGGLA